MSEQFTEAGDWAYAACVPHAGTGTLVRAGSIVMLVGGSDPARVGQFVDHVSMVSANGGSARQLVRGLAIALSSDPDTPPLVALAGYDRGLAVFVSGDALAYVDDHVIDGRDSLAWIERTIPWPVASVRISLADTAAAEGSPYRLNSGVIPADGCTLSRAEQLAMPGPPLAADDATPPPPASRRETTPAPPPEPVEAAPPVDVVKPVEPVAPPPAPADPKPLDRPALAESADPEQPTSPPKQFEAISLEPDPLEAAPEPLPKSTDPGLAKPDEGGSGPPEVQGVYCKNRHFNDPRVLFCAVCGINMVQQTPVLVPGPRPPVGVVVVDDGSVFQLDTDYLLGRDPENSDFARSGGYRSIQLTDLSQQISRVHARLELRGWDVVLVDNRSTNGTYFIAPKTTTWVQLPPGAEQVLSPGTRIRIGDRIVAYNTHHGN